MKIKAFLSLVLVLALSVTLIGCKKKAEENNNSIQSVNEEAEKGRDYITLLYSSADSFNPYKTKTDVNRQLVKLIYEPLIKVSDSFAPVNALAKKVTLSGKTCTVYLKNAVFSDGSSVGADDVVYSYNLAKKSKTSYAEKLYGVKSVNSSGGKIVFKLKSYDPYFKNVLDFPIIKKGSDKKTDSDSVSLPPIGCGRYKINKARDGLVINNSYYGEKGSIKKVKLINAPDQESVSHYTEIGAADMYFSEISDGNITRMSGKREEISLNNLVYIGINQNKSQLKNQVLRQALSSALNRTKLCEEAFYNNAVPAKGVFHPAWQETKSVQNLETVTNNEITIENLKEIGYNKLNKDGIRVNSNGTPLSFTLLVNSENRIRVLAANTIASQLKAAGIKITVVEKSFKQYKKDLKKGNFQLYLGEIKFTDNMDVSALFVKGGSAAYGLPKAKVAKKADSNKDEKTNKTTAKAKTTTSQEVLEQYFKGKATIKDVASVLQTDMAVIPICYRTGVLFYNNSLVNVKNSSASDIYFSINSYLIN